MAPRDERVEVGKGAEERVDVLVVADVVAVVVHRRAVDRREPQHVDAEPLEVVEVRRDAGDVAHAVAVAVGERARVDLVDHGGAPPARRPAVGAERRVAGRSPSHPAPRGAAGPSWVPRWLPAAATGTPNRRRYRVADPSQDLHLSVEGPAAARRYCGRRGSGRTRRGPHQGLRSGAGPGLADPRHRRRHHRAGRCQRGGQVDAAEDPARADPGDRWPRRGARPRHRHRGRVDPRGSGLPARARLPPTRRQRQRLRRAHGDDVGAAPGRRPRARRRGAAARRARRGALPPDGRLLHRHEAEGQARPGAGPRPPPGAPRRADQRPRPGRPRRDARPRAPDRPRLRHRRHRHLAPAR